MNFGSYMDADKILDNICISVHDITRIYHDSDDIIYITNMDDTVDYDSAYANSIKATIYKKLSENEYFVRIHTDYETYLGSIIDEYNMVMVSIYVRVDGNERYDKCSYHDAIIASINYLCDNII